MPRHPSEIRSSIPKHPIPWSCAGGPDQDYSSTDRRQHLAALTDPRLAVRARGVDPDCELDYERMIRLLDLVWDCPHDGAVNVTGYRCSRCAGKHVFAALAAHSRDLARPPSARAESTRASAPPRS